jgi:arsenate reductase (thioredoxin)
MTSRRKVLFLCTHNSARSQMAEGLLRSMYGDRYESYSAGVSPTFVDQDAITVMAEIGIDISGQISKGVLEFRGQSFDLVATVCDRASETCPLFPGQSRKIHKSFDDPASRPADERLEAFRRSRDEIMAWIEEIFGSGV